MSSDGVPSGAPNGTYMCAKYRALSALKGYLCGANASHVKARESVLL